MKVHTVVIQGKKKKRFISHKLLFVVSTEITFYRWGGRSAHPQILNSPPNEWRKFIFVTGENSNMHLVPYLSDEPKQGTLVFPSGLSSRLSSGHFNFPLKLSLCLLIFSVWKRTPLLYQIISGREQHSAWVYHQFCNSNITHI